MRQKNQPPTFGKKNSVVGRPPPSLRLRTLETAVSNEHHGPVTTKNFIVLDVME